MQGLNFQSSWRLLPPNHYPGPKPDRLWLCRFATIPAFSFHSLTVLLLTVPLWHINAGHVVSFLSLLTA